MIRIINTTARKAGRAFTKLAAPYRIVHVDGRDYHRDVFAAWSFTEAAQWAACALNYDRVLITYRGRIVAERAPLSI
jgi:hypothetical protein